MEDHHFTTLVQQGCVCPAAQPAPVFLRLFLGFACFSHFNACAIIGLVQTAHYCKNKDGNIPQIIDLGLYKCTRVFRP